LEFICGKAIMLLQNFQPDNYKSFMTLMNTKAADLQSNQKHVQRFGWSEGDDIQR